MSNPLALFVSRRLLAVAAALLCLAASQVASAAMEASQRAGPPLAIRGVLRR